MSILFDEMTNIVQGHFNVKGDARECFFFVLLPTFTWKLHLFKKNKLNKFLKISLTHTPTHGNLILFMYTDLEQTSKQSNNHMKDSLCLKKPFQQKQTESVV